MAYVRETRAVACDGHRYLVDSSGRSDTTPPLDSDHRRRTLPGCRDQRKLRIDRHAQGNAVWLLLLRPRPHAARTPKRQYRAYSAVPAYIGIEAVGHVAPNSNGTADLPPASATGGREARSQPRSTSLRTSGDDAGARGAPIGREAPGRCPPQPAQSIGSVRRRARQTTSPGAAPASRRAVAATPVSQSTMNQEPRAYDQP